MKCKFTTSNKQCNAFAMDSSEYCYVHNPEVTNEEKQMNCSKGGKSKPIKIENPLPAIQIDTVSEVRIMLVETINKIRSGEMDIKTANSIGFLAGKLLDTLEIEKIDRKLSRLEEALILKH